MNFSSTQYLVFISAVFLIYWHTRRPYQNLFLLLASYFFYACWNGRFLSLIFLVTIVDYLCGARIHRARSAASKKRWLALSLAVNIGTLGFFKYFNFFVETFVSAAHSIGWPASFSTLNILLPIGISFYVFRSMSYSLDIYRGTLQPTRSFVDYALFVSFFPHLAAGPITRATELIPQLERKRAFSGEDLEAGLTRFLWGFFNKTFIADTLAFYLVDPVFAAPGKYSSATLWFAMVGYTLQIYADFSGYSSMGIGSARILGFRLPENFDLPYMAVNISEFWRRWHMTMSRFFRDYIYFGLGGNRKGKGRALFNVAVTTVASGLWHGAGMTFILWGALHGLYIVLYHFWSGRWARRAEPALYNLLPAWFFTQAAVCLSRVLFRSADLSTASVYFKGLVSSSGMETMEVPPLVWMAIFFFVIDHVAGWMVQRNPGPAERIPVSLRAMAYAAMILFLFHACLESANAFIYFKF
ncbi:MAG: MBOAT family protein [Candidatus Manganitrophaceae bacterium]|nr:MAG: MBOAT family protein [Candidatus Manganitrophaceae bacterium]